MAGGETRFQLLARVTDIKRHVGVTLKADVPDDTLTIESWFTVYAGANWHERETHEMFGISFAGHPDLRNMYLPTEFEGYPLRKDFPLLARMVKPWPGLVDVEPMPAEEAPPEDAVAGELAPENPVPDQSDAGLGAAPDEEAAAEAAVAHTVEEAPDHVAPPADDARTDSGSHQDLVAEIPEDVESTEAGEHRPGAAADTDVTPASTPAVPTVDPATTVREEPGDEVVVSADDVVDESEVRRAEGSAVTEDEATPDGRPADDEEGTEP